MIMKAPLPLLVLALAGTALTGCATNAQRDPLEPFNRSMFRFNEKLDENVMQPVARGYVKAVPEPVRNCVGNMFSNVADIWTGANNFLQGKGHDAINDWGRFLLNTTAGGLGCVDLASRVGVPKNREDFGQTLGKWGVGPGFYIVMPVLGPSTLRDLAAQNSVDSRLDIVWNIDHMRTRNQFYVLRAVDTRSNLLSASKMIDEIAIDKYTFTRDAYLQRRYSLIFDGDTPDGQSYNDSQREVDTAQGTPAAPAPAKPVSETVPAADTSAMPPAAEKSAEKPIEASATQPSEPLEAAAAAPASR
jgi:phospholipid-binding lipoprotein MlaA